MSESTPIAHTICPIETIRKLSQLHAVLLANESRERVIQADPTHELAGFIVDGKFDHARLVPLLVVAVNYLAKRVAELEKKE